MYTVTFRWYDTDTYCTNLVDADSAEAVAKHYEDKYGSKPISVKQANPWDVDSAKRKGMPIVTL